MKRDRKSRGRTVPCPTCNRQFHTDAKHKKYCSTDCLKKVRSERAKAVNKTDTSWYKRNRARVRATKAKYGKSEHGKRKHMNGRLLREYGITAEQYDTMLASQGGVCAICCQEESVMLNGNKCRLSVDHDHETGVVRGLLCRLCNAIVGKTKDDIALLESCLEYLRGSY